MEYINPSVNLPFKIVTHNGLTISEHVFSKRLVKTSNV